MKIIKQPRTIISNPDSIFGYFAWPTVARLPDGSLATVCSGFRMRHVCPFGKAVISFSRDDGDTWSRPAPVIDTPLDDRDAGICVYGKNIIVTSFNNTPDFQRQRAEINISKGDNGTSMRFIQGYFGMYPEDAVEKYFGSTYKISRDGGVTFEEMKRSPVTTPHGPFLYGDKVMWVGKIFDKVAEDQGIALAEMDENENFHIKTILPPCEDGIASIHECEPHGITLPDGRILVAIRAQRSGEHEMFTVYTSESSDGGKTFTVPKPIIPVLAGSPPHLMLHSSGALVMSYACRHGNFGIRARVSQDLGKTWGDEIMLTEHAERNDLGYPATVEKKDGSLLTVYYERGECFATIKQIVWEI